MTKRKWAPVSEKYLGQPIGNSQDCDEPGDAIAKETGDGGRIHGRGASGGGSKPTPQARRPGGATAGSTRPRSAQKIRG